MTARSETRIPAAEITLLGTDRSVKTDLAGSFLVRRLAPVVHLIRVRRIGFNAQYLSATLAAGEDKEVAIVLEPSSYKLPEIKVTARLAKPIDYAWTTKYDDFFRQQRVGLGHYISRADIVRKKPWRTASVLHGIPGVRLRFYQHGPSGTDVEVRGCGRVSVWIDGWKQLFPVRARSREHRGSQPCGPRARGQVVNRREAPLAAVEITLLGSGRSVLTDSVGRFLLRDVSPGRSPLIVARLRASTGPRAGQSSRRRGRFRAGSLEQGRPLHASVQGGVIHGPILLRYPTPSPDVNRPGHSGRAFRHEP